MKKEVSEYIESHTKWKQQLSEIRRILLSTDLVECIKWGMPTYTINGKNVVGFSGFKNHCGLWFHNGNLLIDDKGILTNAQEGKTQSMRHYKIYEGDIINHKVIKSYIEEAIKVQKEGRVVAKSSSSKKIKSVEYEIDAVFKNELDNDVTLKNKFSGLTHAQQRDYANYINEAKRSATKMSRLEKIIPLIMEGKTLSSLWSKK